MDVTRGLDVPSDEARLDHQRDVVDAGPGTAFDRLLPLATCSVLAAGALMAVVLAAVPGLYFFALRAMPLLGLAGFLLVVIAAWAGIEAAVQRVRRPPRMVSALVVGGVAMWFSWHQMQVFGAGFV